MSLLTDPTLELVDPREAPTEEQPVVLTIARPALPARRYGPVRRRPRVPSRGWRRVIHLALGGGISVAVAALAKALPTAGPIILVYVAGLLP